LIGHHSKDVQRRKSIGSLKIGSSSFTFSTRHGGLSRRKKKKIDKEQFSDG
jgi:hypothetical protein